MHATGIACKIAMLLKVTLNKGQESSVVPTGPWQQNLPLKEDNLSITVKLAG